MSLPPYDQSMRELERQYQVVLPDSVGQPALGFRDGVWFRVSGGAPRPVLIRSAIILCPHAAGSIVQIACWWMRENAHSSRALDLATELALCVGELARKAIEDDPLGMADDPLSNSQQNAVAGFGASQSPLSSGGYGASPMAGAGLGSSGGYDTGGYQSGGYQTSTDPYASPYGAGAPAAGATTVLPQIPADGYGMPPAQRGPAIPPRGQGMPAGGPNGSGGYPQQRPGPPMRPQPRPQPQPQPQGGYPQQSQGGRPPQRPAPRPEYDDDPYGRPQPPQQGRPAW
jgi:hypothetical protein